MVVGIVSSVVGEGRGATLGAAVGFGWLRNVGVGAAVGFGCAVVEAAVGFGWAVGGETAVAGSSVAGTAGGEAGAAGWQALAPTSVTRANKDTAQRWTGIGVEEFLC
ncbi:MAG: hypothetical protein E6I52_03630 [Chloroflexi bacterium]|nr:MAG: hypothetical protein E6I52_03630 [Chloroflexota bacterium]